MQFNLWKMDRQPSAINLLGLVSQPREHKPQCLEQHPSRATKAELPFHPFFHPEIFPQIYVCHCLQFLRSWWKSCWLEAQHQSVPIALGTHWDFAVQSMGMPGTGMPGTGIPQEALPHRAPTPKPSGSNPRELLLTAGLCQCCPWMSRL